MRRYRRNVDVAMRRLERAVSQGDPAAAEAYLFKTAQNGTWFKPRGWKAPGGFPYAHNVNSDRAYYVRLLSFLRWPGAKELQQTVASQAPPRRERTHRYMDRWPGDEEAEEVVFTTLDPAEPMHLLAQSKPFAKLGPKTAEGIGGPVMEVLAGAATEHVFLLTKLAPAYWTDAMAAVRGLRKAGAEYDLRRDPLGHEAGMGGSSIYALLKKEQRPHSDTLRELRVSVRPPRDVSFSQRAPESMAGHEARNAYDEFFGTFGIYRRDMSEYFADAYEHATQAEAWACEARRGQKGVPGTAQVWGIRTRRPSRACATKANKLIKRAVTPPVLVAIASQLMKYQ